MPYVAHCSGGRGDCAAAAAAAAAATAAAAERLRSGLVGAPR